MLYIHVRFTKSSQELFSREMCFFSNKTTDKNNKRHHKKGQTGDTSVFWEVTRRGHTQLIRKGRDCRKPPPALLEKMGSDQPHGQAGWGEGQGLGSRVTVQLKQAHYPKGWMATTCGFNPELKNQYSGTSLVVQWF